MYEERLVMKAIGYVRVSTEEQAREGISLENQKVKIRIYCDLHNFELEKIIEDAGKSGKDLNREGIQELIQKVKDKRIGAVLVYKLDRLSRKVIDTLNLIELMKKNHVEFHSIIDSIDTKTAMGKFFINIMASLAQMERDLISERTKDALRMKITKNERAGQIPYGWTLANDGKTLVMNVEEQKAIRFIRALRKEGYNYSAICRELTRQGYQPLGGYWYAQSIKNILKRAA
jgi:DNA invertase Pin-like site-specific DNA recombinase